MKDYDPSLPWLAKIRIDGELVCEFYIYVDDVRVTAPTEEEMWKAIRVISSKLSYLGIQDAARKRRPPSRRPDEWAGSMIYLDDDHVGVYIDHDNGSGSRLINVLAQQKLNEDPTLV